MKTISATSNNIFSNYVFPLYVFIRRLYIELNQKQVKDVFFLSREGQFLKRLYDIYSSHKEGNQNTHYLYASRNSLYGCVLKSFELEDFEYIFLSKENVCIHDFLYTLGFEEDYISRIITECGFSSGKDIFSKNELETVKERLSGSSFFLQKYEKNRLYQREALKEYLESFNVSFEDDGLFLVDVGWKGAMQDFLYRFFDNKVNIEGYYIGYRGQHGDNSKSNRKHGLLWSNMPYCPTILDSIFHFRMMNYENILRADHNSVMKYKKGDNDFYLLNNLVNDNKVYNDLIKDLQNEITEKFVKLCEAAQHKPVSDEACALLYSKMFAMVRPSDYRWLHKCSNTHFDFFAKMGTFSNKKINWYAYLRYRLGGVRLYWNMVNGNNEKLRNY